MNILKPKTRAHLGAAFLDMLMRIKTWPDTVKTLDVNWLTFHYLLRHKSCGKPKKVDDEEENAEESNTNSEDDVEEMDDDSNSDNSESDDSPDTDSDLEDEMQNQSNPEHNYAFNPVGRIVRPNDAPLFTIFNTFKATALTATPNGVRTEIYDPNNNNQKWFCLESVIFTYDGRVLKVNEIDQQATFAQRYDRSNPKHKWNILPVGQNQDHRIVSAYNNLNLDLIGQWGWNDVVINVGGRKKITGIDEIQQLWKINNPNPCQSFPVPDTDTDSDED